MDTCTCSCIRGIEESADWNSACMLINISLCADGLSAINCTILLLLSKLINVKSTNILTMGSSMTLDATCSYSSLFFFTKSDCMRWDAWKYVRIMRSQRHSKNEGWSKLCEFSKYHHIETEVELIALSFWMISKYWSSFLRFTAFRKDIDNQFILVRYENRADAII